MAGAQEQQLADLRALDLVPDLTLVQSQFHARHLAVFNLARKLGAIYACDCSRKDVQAALALEGVASAPHSGLAPVYSGHCRLHGLSGGDAVPSSSPAVGGGIAWRFKMPRLDGRNDFIVARTTSSESDDGFTPAYHWACAIDDFDGAYRLIVRSLDLAPARALQHAIQTWLAKAEHREPPVIHAFHTSLVTQNDGQRLEKRTQGVTLPELIEAGFTRERLLAAFNASFDRSLIGADGFDHDGVARERAETLAVESLLVSKF